MIIKVKVEDIIYEVEIEDLHALPVVARIGDEIFMVWPEISQEPATLPDRIHRQQAATGMQTSNKDRIVPAPLPGTIFKVFVKDGLKVEIGDPLLVIEAMKMKNTIRSGRSGIIAAIHVHTGEAVKHHQSLIEFTD